MATAYNDGPFELIYGWRAGIHWTQDRAARVRATRAR